jgi:8-oxo-dGTP pyrophosphatase MutT (NUDIX family)
MTPGSGSERANASKWPVRRAESFGGIVFRPTNDDHEVALIRIKSLKGKDVWTLPKGTAEDGETPEETALREVQEETGIRAEIVEPLEDITYWFTFAPEKVRYRKTVHFYLMRAVGGDPNLHDDEVEEVRFVPVDEAPRLVSYPTDRKILKRVAELARTW